MVHLYEVVADGDTNSQAGALELSPGAVYGALADYDNYSPWSVVPAE